jgi:hypothetical protein
MNKQVSPAVAAILILAVLAVIGFFAYRTWTHIEKAPPAPTSVQGPPPGAEPKLPTGGAK